MKLSDQALGAIMLALQKSLMEQTDITGVLKNFDFVTDGPQQSELFVRNPPVVKFDQELAEEDA